MRCVATGQGSLPAVLADPVESDVQRLGLETSRYGKVLDCVFGDHVQQVDWCDIENLSLPVNIDVS